MKGKIYIQKIQDNFSNLKFNRVRLISSGYDSDVVVLDEKIVFSFPKPKHDCLEKLRRQLKIVPLLNKEISLSIPNYKYIPKSKSFVGYRYIKGVPLSNKIIKELNDKQREACAKQIATFINELHQFPVQIAKRNGVEASSKSSNLKIKQVVIHYDLIDEHILFSLQKERIVGIIDFGDIVIADPALEFSRIWRYGEKFLDLILKHYKTSDNEIKKRSRLLWLASRKVC